MIVVRFFSYFIILLYAQLGWSDPSVDRIANDDLSLPNHASSLPFKIVANPQAPYKFENDGLPAGIDYDVISIVMAELEIPFELRFIQSDGRIHALAKSGDIDMALLFSKTADREKYLHYPQESYVDISWHFFILKTRENDIRFETLSDLRGLVIGATRDIAYTEEFWQSGLKLDRVTGNHLQLPKLQNGRIDAVPLNTISTLYQIHQDPRLSNITFLDTALKKKAYYNVISRRSQHPDTKKVISHYDAIILALKRNGKIKEIYQRYLGRSELLCQAIDC